MWLLVDIIIHRRCLSSSNNSIHPFIGRSQAGAAAASDDDDDDHDSGGGSDDDDDDDDGDV